MNMPLVPDESKLAPTDLDYFLRVTEEDEKNLRAKEGGLWRFFHYSQEDTDSYIQQYQEVVLPSYRQALALVDEYLSHSDLNGDGKACLMVQQSIISNMIHVHEYLLCSVRAAQYRLAHLKPAAGAPTFRDLQEKMRSLPTPRRANGLVPEDEPNMPPEIQERRRQDLIARHMNDELAQVDLGHIPVHIHPGLEGFPGAHVGSSC